MISHCGFDLNFSVTDDVEHLYMCLWPLYVLFGGKKTSIQASSHSLIGLFVWFFVLILSYILYMLNINSLSVILFANTFSFSMGCLFVLLMATFAVTNILSLIRSHLFLLLISFAVRDRLKKCCNFCQKEFCLCSFQGVCGFRSLIHLEFIFV